MQIPISRKGSWYLVFFCLLVLAATGFAQNPNSASTNKQDLAPAISQRDEQRQEKLNSKLLEREVPYRILLPRSYFNSNETVRCPVLYLLHGLAGHFDNWTDKTKIAQYAAAYNFIIVMPEGADGWYTDSATVPNDKYESYIVRELIPEIDKKFRTIADRNHRAIAGLSMGGYGAIKFGLKYPEMFSVVGSFSGALNATSPSALDIAPGWKELIDSLASVYGPENSQTRKDNDIYRMLTEVSADKVKTLPFIYLDCGTEDTLIKPNRDFDALLLDKKVPHEFRERPGKHEWPYWDQQVQEFFGVAGRQGLGIK
jgi:putative tributyrin esterase